MPWARLDDRYHNSPKIKAAWRRCAAAVGLHVFAITYCNQHVTDGLIDRAEIDLWLYDSPLTAKQKADALTVLLELRLLDLAEGECYRVHDFLDWNLSREQRDHLSDVGKRGGRPRGKSQGFSQGFSQGKSQGLSQGESQGKSQGETSPRHASPEPLPASQVARKRATRQVDQSIPPENFPDNLSATLEGCLGTLRRVWDIRGGREPQPRGVGLAIMRNPRASHEQVARKLEHWLLAGNGQRARCADVTARFGDWVAEEQAAGKLLPLVAQRESPSDLLNAMQDARGDVA